MFRTFETKCIKRFLKKTKIKKTLDFILHIISYSSVETRKHKALSDKQKLKKALKSVIKTLLGEEKTCQKRRFRPFGTFPTVRKKLAKYFIMSIAIYPQHVATCFLYADDILLIAPSVSGLEISLSACEEEQYAVEA